MSKTDEKWQDGTNWNKWEKNTKKGGNGDKYVISSKKIGKLGKCGERCENRLIMINWPKICHMD